MKTDITFVLDRSGSMDSCKIATISSFNQFIKEQQELDGSGDCVFTLVQFDDQYEVPISARNILQVAKIDGSSYVPRGSTAFLDAMGKTIANIRERTMDSPPDKTIVVVLTDGYENSSKDWTREKVKTLVEEMTNLFGWQFIYLGANMDAPTVAADFGFLRQNSMSYNTSVGGMKSSIGTVSNLVSYARTGGTSGQSVVTNQNRQDAMQGDENDKSSTTNSSSDFARYMRSRSSAK